MEEVVGALGFQRRSGGSGSVPPKDLTAEILYTHDTIFFIIYQFVYSRPSVRKTMLLQRRFLSIILMVDRSAQPSTKKFPYVMQLRLEHYFLHVNY